MLISIFSTLGQTLLFIIIKLAYTFKLIRKRNYYKFLRGLVKFNGPVTIKAFQMFSCGKEIEKYFDKEFLKLISELQYNCYPNKKRRLKNYYIKKSIASGSVGEVYLLTDKNKNERILKINHDSIRNEILSSIEKLNLVINLTYFFDKKIYNLIKNLDLNEFKRLMLSQTYLDIEAKNTKKISRYV